MASPASPTIENTYADQLDGAYVAVEPRGFPAPELRLLNRPLARELGLDVAWLEAHGAAVLSGSETAPGSRPIAQAYAGHQFGSFNPQLGDGRALLLGEVVAPDGRRVDVQLKGSGATPFSRGGDGRAGLDSALREYIVSEAMHALGIPTTRALAVVSTGETIYRDEQRPGAVLTRVAASHLRIGTVQFFAARRRTDTVRQLVDYALQRHYPDAVGDPNPARALLERVARAQGALVARWMLVGFVHGVMNTDNVALSGETIDYGPCAFMDKYDPGTVFSRIDHMGRYAYGNQPNIGAWNMGRLAESVLDLLHDDESQAVALAESALAAYGATLHQVWTEGMRAKIGLTDTVEGDDGLVEALLVWMRDAGVDYTSTFRALASGLRGGEIVWHGDAHRAWHAQWLARLGDADPQQVADAMDAVNPLYIPRNHKVEEALAAALDGDLGPTHQLMTVLSRPFTEQPLRQSYALPAPPEFGRYRTHCNT